MEARLPNLRLPLDLWCLMSLGIISVLDFESWLTLYAKRGTIKLAFSRIFLEKYDFLQNTPNIGILYTIGNHFSSRLWIRDLYLKIRLCLAQIQWQSFAISHGKACRQSGHFRRDRGYHLEEQVEMSTLASRTASGLARERQSDVMNSWLSRVRYTHLLRYSLTVAKQPPTLSPLPELNRPACVVFRSLEACDHRRSRSSPREREREREKERERTR